MALAPQAELSHPCLDQITVTNDHDSEVLGLPASEATSRRSATRTAVSPSLTLTGPGIIPQAHDRTARSAATAFQSLSAGSLGRVSGAPPSVGHAGTHAVLMSRWPLHVAPTAGAPGVCARASCWQAWVHVTA